MPIALLFSLYMGMFSVGSFLSLSRTICFFPFFLAGYRCQQENIAKIRETKTVFSITAFAIALIVAGILSNLGIKTATLFLNASYKYLGQTYLQGIMLRLVLLITGFLCIFGFLSTTPTWETIISNVGMYSITVYLGHSVVIRVLKYMQIINISNPLLFLVFAVIFSLAVCFALGNRKIFPVLSKDN